VSSAYDSEPLNRRRKIRKREREINWQTQPKNADKGCLNLYRMREK
jgi:hypothetical protein